MRKHVCGVTKETRYRLVKLFEWSSTYAVNKKGADQTARIFWLIRAFCSHMSNQVFSCRGSNLSLVVRKPVIGVSDLVRHKPGCAVTEDG